MKSNSSKLAFTGSVVLLAAGIAQAHPGHNGHGGLYGGFAHPFSGIDHILAMTAVGLLAVQNGKRALWLLPLTFLALMVAGGLLNLSGVSVPFVEQSTSASVLVLGLLIALAGRMPMGVPTALVGLFAVFHGYAHVGEMNAGASPAFYAVGFITATAILHAIGIALGLLARRTAPEPLLRLGGAAIAACGLLLVTGLITA